ncbi:MAG: CvpA family protein [Chloroflexi bacterium]|nr:CvpA family protein [Chloroflexota bacterium]
MEFLGGIGTFDVLVIVFLLFFFVLGYIQGAIRRLLGLAAALFSFLLAANLYDPLGQFLARNWHQFAREYSYMIGFGTIFVAATIAFTLIIQGFYRTQPLFDKARFVDELIGGFLGLVQAALLIGAITVILDSFFRIPGIPPSGSEVPFLRDFWEVLDGSKTAEVFRGTIIPGFFLLFGLFIPSTIEAFFPSRPG